MKSIRLNIGKVAMMFMLIMTVFVSEIQAQVVDDSHSHRPKVGVVLCGGGAKGFAQIRILKALDEAGVPIDYIGGTSIGSIIGALYAVGYDPDMIEKLVREQDWNQVLYDKFSEELMPIDRRMNERRYLATFPITNGKMKVKSAFVEGVYVNMLLSRLMLPAHNIQDYSKLSVPFYCIATDVEHACQYEMTSGSLPRSVRASMSIPFLFQPVTIDGRLLIDGGMVNNFPVRNMKEHGADIIIGIDLEDESIPASQIDNSLQLFTSLMNLSSLEESLYARNHCNIYIKPDLHGRDMLSFNDFDSIIQFGQDAADKFYPQFQRLADSLQNLGHFEINRPHVQPVEKIKIVGINVEGIPENHKHSFARLYATEFPATVTLDKIEELIVKLKISGYYDNLWYYISDAPDGYILNIHCDEVADKSMSAAIHYDNNYGIGALVNFTFNNVMKSIDRSTISLDVNIAENPYIKGHFNTQMGKYFRMG
ncbi:MAG: patatin-like phospholipase family protein, partial [Bacteroidales bacterium]|nr:patatin-like phospholipase family protein [Bacteroidales bacterium]